MNVDWGLAGAVILSGLAIVFIVLIVLILLVMLTSKIVNSATEKSAATAARLVGPATKPAVPVVQSGIDEETVAVISAAAYSYLNIAGENKGGNYAVKSISRATGGRPVWGFAGMQQNTRPF